ncbi:hypothetical protein CH063_11583, partial [Colletotrichum higginsianum]
CDVEWLAHRRVISKSYEKKKLRDEPKRIWVVRRSFGSNVDAGADSSSSSTAGREGTAFVGL